MSSNPSIEIGRAPEFISLADFPNQLKVNISGQEYTFVFTSKEVLEGGFCEVRRAWMQTSKTSWEPVVIRTVKEAWLKGAYGLSDIDDYNQYGPDFWLKIHWNFQRQIEHYNYFANQRRKTTPRVIGGGPFFYGGRKLVALSYEGLSLNQPEIHNKAMNDDKFLQNIILNLAMAVQYQHSFGCIHGDLSAKNVLVNQQGKVCLIDPALFSDEGSLTLGMRNLKYCPKCCLNLTPIEKGQHTLIDAHAFLINILELLSEKRLYASFTTSEVEEDLKHLTAQDLKSIVEDMLPGRIKLQELFLGYLIQTHNGTFQEDLRDVALKINYLIRTN